MSSCIELEGVYYRTAQAWFWVICIENSITMKVYLCSVWIFFLLNKWLEMITTTHSNTKRSPCKSKRESFFWIDPFMVRYLYVWMASTSMTREVTCSCTSAVDKWFTMHPSVFIAVLIHLFTFFAFIVTIQLTLLLEYQV